MPEYTRICKMWPNCVVSDYDCTICPYYGGKTKKIIKCLIESRNCTTDNDENFEERSKYGSKD